MNLRLKQAKWNTNNPIHLELSNGQFIKAGTNQSFTETHTFDAKKKINRVEVIIKKGETMILWINFYSCQQTLVKVGENDKWVILEGEKLESFEIDNCQQLIGCKVYSHNYSCKTFDFTWIKMKVY